MGKFARKNQKEQRIDAKRNTRKPKKLNAGISVIEEEEHTDAAAEDYLRDDVDQFSRNKIKDSMHRGFQSDEEDSNHEEEILPVGESSSDESDDDQEKSDEEGGLPSRSAWGSKRSNFYNTDFVDKDHGRFHGSDAEEAEEEEREARELQAKIASELSEGDFGLSELEKISENDQAAMDLDVSSEEPVLLLSDISKLTEFEKAERLKHESPELLNLIADCKKNLKYLNEILPLLSSLNNADKKFLSPMAELYLRVKYQLILGYCQNLFFYMSLKSKRMSLENHSVTRRLVDFRRLLLKLSPFDQMHGSAVEKACQVIQSGEDLATLCQKSSIVNKTQKKVSFSKTVQPSGDSQKPLPLSKLIGLKQELNPKVRKSMIDDNSDNLDAEEEQIPANDTVEGKRALTYQIFKNKGTTAYRKKEYRNPRVKHRMKYRKALISRKGQVRTHRSELKKYSGEASGIRAGVVKSVKFK